MASSTIFFNERWYLEQNPDVAHAVNMGYMTAEFHFRYYGIKEGRAGSASFDEEFYLTQNPDVAAAVAAGSMTAVQHFVMYGQHEIRSYSPVFDSAAYLAANPDVEAAVRNGEVSAVQHFTMYGFAEGRSLGNGILLSDFHNDPQFNDATQSRDAEAALARVAQVAPFLPGFVPPEGWQPKPDTPIPVDFVPPEGLLLVIPDGIQIPEGLTLPSHFQAPTPTPAPQPVPPVIDPLPIDDGTPTDPPMDTDPGDGKDSDPDPDPGSEPDTGSDPDAGSDPAPDPGPDPSPDPLPPADPGSDDGEDGPGTDPDPNDGTDDESEDDDDPEDDDGVDDDNDPPEGGTVEIGVHTGTNGDDTFLGALTGGSISLDGKGGHDKVELDVKNLNTAALGSVSTKNVETVHIDFDDVRVSHFLDVMLANNPEQAEMLGEMIWLQGASVLGLPLSTSIEELRLEGSLKTGLSSGAIPPLRDLLDFDPTGDMTDMEALLTTLPHLTVDLGDELVTDDAAIGSEANANPTLQLAFDSPVALHLTGKNLAELDTIDASDSNGVLLDISGYGLLSLNAENIMGVIARHAEVEVDFPTPGPQYDVGLSSFVGSQHDDMIVASMDAFSQEKVRIDLGGGADTLVLFGHQGDSDHNTDLTINFGGGSESDVLVMFGLANIRAVGEGDVVVSDIILENYSYSHTPVALLEDDTDVGQFLAGADLSDLVKPATLSFTLHDDEQDYSLFEALELVASEMKAANANSSGPDHKLAAFTLYAPMESMDGADTGEVAEQQLVTYIYYDGDGSQTLSAGDGLVTLVGDHITAP